MAKITAAEFAANARSYIGQPYSKIDCAKLINLASKGKIKATGSNYQWRYETSETGRISDGKPSDPYPKGNDRKSSQLEVGMGVFMHKAQDTKKYPDGLGDYCHVGVVTSVKPLRITNSNDPKGVMDYTRIGTFCAWCRFSDVDYGDIHQEEKEVETMLYQAKVIDGALKVRNNPAGTKIGSLKNGSSVDVYEEQGDWCRVSQGRHVRMGDEKIPAENRRS